VRIERSVDEYDCGKTDPPSQLARAEWLEDGSLASYMHGPGANPAVYDAFSIGRPAARGVWRAGASAGCCSSGCSEGRSESVAQSVSR